MTGVATTPPDVADAARRLIDGVPPARAAPADARTLALAWALKEQCYAAWSSQPKRAAKAARALRTLCDRSGADPAGNVAPASAIAREIAALADWTDGIAHITRGNMAEAVQSFDAAAGAFHALGRANEATQTQVPKIMALSMLGRYDAAIDCAERAQRAFVAQRDVRGAGKVSLNLGGLHGRRGNYAQAAQQSRAASVLFARVGDHERSVQADINLADALTSMGDFDEALRIYARARMRASAHDHPVLQTLVEESVALLQLARGRYREALAGFESARRQYELLGMPQHLAIAEKQLADAYLELRLLPEAVALYDQVLARLATLDAADEQAWTLAQRGRAQALLGRAAQADESFERALALFGAQGIGIGQAAVTLARAELALEAGNPALATTLAARAGDAFAGAGRSDGRARADVVRAHALLRTGSIEQAQSLFAATRALAHALQLLTVQVRCRVGQGLAYQALGQNAAARAAYDEAVELFEDQRRALPGDELRSAFLTDHLLPYQELLRLALQDHADAPSADSACSVLRQLERVRARALGERVAGASPGAADASTQALRERLNWLYRNVLRLDDDASADPALGEELRRTENELLERARRARLTAAPLARTEDDAFEPAALQAALGQGDALVEYDVLDDELFACIVTTEGVQVQRQLAAWPEVEEALRAARFQIETLRHGSAPVQQHLSALTARAQRRLDRLHALVWQPLAAHLTPSRRLLIVPCRSLAALPFAALPHGPQLVLAQRFVLAVVPSARLALHGLQHQPAPPKTVLALGESSRLPHAAREAIAVASMFEAGMALVGDQASVAALQQHAPQADAIHLACHAQFRSDNPMFSALHLHDAALSVEAVEALTLRAGTVVLSACDTALSGAGGGDDERVGLVRAFLLAGAARVLAALWPVEDEITATFMAYFYAALRAGHSPAQALQQAQVRRMATHPHPFFWAAFALHGGW